MPRAAKPARYPCRPMPRAELAGSRAILCQLAAGFQPAAGLAQRRRPLAPPPRRLMFLQHLICVHPSRHATASGRSSVAQTRNGLPPLECWPDPTTLSKLPGVRGRFKSPVHDGQGARTTSRRRHKPPTRSRRPTGSTRRAGSASWLSSYLGIGPYGLFGPDRWRGLLVEDGRWIHPRRGGIACTFMHPFRPHDGGLAGRHVPTSG